MKAFTAAAPLHELTSPASADSHGELALAAGDQRRGRLMVCREFRFPATQFHVSVYSGQAPLPASSLVNSAYSRLGYALAEAPAGPDPVPEAAASLHAVHEGRTLGTLSVHLDSSGGLNAESLYPEEIVRFRSHGRLCEFTRLALDTGLAGREVLCSLFYMAYVFSHAVHRARHLFIEVNPRHESFYERMLGFRRLGRQKLCPRVSAPAVLLHLDFDFTREQIERSRLGLAVARTTLYRYAAPTADEQAMIRHMTAAIA